MFAVDHHEVVAEGAEDLHHVGSVTGDDGAEYDSAVVELGLGGVGAHGGTPGVLPVLLMNKGRVKRTVPRTFQRRFRSWPGRLASETLTLLVGQTIRVDQLGYAFQLSNYGV